MQAGSEFTYDPGAVGGTTTIEVDVASKTGATYRVRWVPVPEPQAPHMSVRSQFSDGEFTGPAFSPDGHTLFACIQDPAPEG